MTTIQKNITIGLAALMVLAGLALGAWLSFGSPAFSAVSENEAKTQFQTHDQFVYQPLLVATTTTATSTNNSITQNQQLRIAGAKKVNVYFGRGWGGGNTGSSEFRIQVTPDGTNWYYYNKFQENASTTPGSSSLTLTTGVTTIPAGTSTIEKSLDLQYDSFYALRCIVIETTDGSHTCAASAEF